MWSKVVGHKRQIDQIKRTLASKRIPNAYLFHGPNGVGKRLIANALSQAMACERTETVGFNACGECAACRKTAAGNHPDRFVIEPEESAKAAFRSIKIDAIRELKAELQFHPLEASQKLAIIDDADRMAEPAANSLLKILEEPPHRTHFVLITAFPHHLLPTIRSRCQHVAFQPLRAEEIAAYLERETNAPKEEAVRIARLSGGSLGTALALEADFVRGILDRFFTISKRGSAADILETAWEWKSMEPKRIPLVFDILASWYRDLLRYHTTGSEAELIHPEAGERADATTPARAIASLADIEAARLSAGTTANKQLMFEQLLFTLTGP